MVVRPPVALCAALTLVSGSCGCRPEPAGAPLRVDLVAASGVDPVPRAVAAATQIGLIGVDGRGDVVPQLASSWRIADDSNSVIFRLRPAVAAGRPVTAATVVAAFRRLAGPAKRGGAGQVLAALANGDAVLRGSLPPTALGVDAPVGNVVEVRAAGAIPGLLSVLAQPEFVVAAAPPSPGALHVVDPAGRPVMLVRTPDTGAAALSDLALTASDDPGPAIARFAHDRADVVIGGGMAGFDDARLLAASNALHVELSWGVYGYVVHLAGPLADPRVRRALAMAIDRDDLGSRLFGVALTPVLGLVPPLPSEPAPALPDWAIEGPSARLDLARQLLVAAGIGPAQPLTVTISLPEGHEHANVAAEIASDWLRIGVRTQTITRSLAAHARAVAAGSFELALVERTSPLDTPLAFLTPFACVPGGYCHPGADALVTAARTASGAAAAATALAAAEAALVADTPMIALFVPLRWALVSPRVTGWFDNRAGQHPLALLGISGKHSARP